jgi:hypothetical protein
MQRPFLHFSLAVRLLLRQVLFINRQGSAKKGIRRGQKLDFWRELTVCPESGYSTVKKYTR